MAAPINLPPLVQKIILDPSGVKGGAAALTRNMKPVAAQTAKTAGGINGMSNSINTLGFRAQTTGRMLMRGIGMPIVAIGALAVNSFAKFETAMVKIEALVGVSAGGVAQFAEAVKDVARVTGRGPQELADAMFFVSSAGLRGATAMEVMEASAKGAAIGLGETKVVADAATSAVNAYGAENLSGADSVDVLTAAVREGKVEANRLAPAIGKAIPVASAMGIEFHEVAAAISAMTRTGTDARTSAIQLRQIMQSILDPSRQTEAALRKMGIAQGELAKQAREQGLLSVLMRLREEANKNEEAFADVFPNIRALAGAMDITGENLQENIGIFARLAESAGDTDDAFKKVEKTAGHKMKVAWAQLQTEMVDLGEAMLPLIDITVGFIGVIKSIIKVFAENKGIAVFTLALGIAAIAMGALMAVTGKAVTALSLYSMATIKGTADTGMLTASMWGLNTAMYAMPIIAIIASLVALFVLFSRLGRESKTSTDELYELHQAMSDVRIVGDLSIKPIHDYADAIRDVGHASREAELSSAFFDAYGDFIKDAGEVSELGGMQAAENALLTMFSGQGDTAEMQSAFKHIFEQLNASFDAGDDMFARLFEGMDMDEAISTVLQGGENVADAQVEMWVDGFFGSVETAIEAAQTTMSNSPHSGLNLLDLLIGRETDRSDIEAALVEPVSLVVNKIKRGDIREAVNIYEEIMGRIATSTELTAEEQGAALGLVEKSFMDQLHKQDLFTEDMGKGFDTMAGFLRHLNETNLEDGVLQGDFAGIKHWETLASHMEVAAAIARDEFSEGIITAEMLDVRTISIAGSLMEGFARREREAAEAAKPLARNVKDAFLDIETAIASAEGEADKFIKRFEMLTGTVRGLDEVQRSVNDSMVEMVATFKDGDGTLSNFTAAGRESRDAFMEVADAAAEAGEVVLKAGGSQEMAIAAMREVQDMMRVNAVAQGISPEEIEGAMEVAFGGDDVWNKILAMDDKDMIGTELEERLKVLQEGANTIFGTASGTTMGEEFMAGLNAGAINGFDAVRTTLEGLLSEDLIKQLQKILGIKSPSIVFSEKIGKPITAGIAHGILERKKALRNTVRELVEDAISEARKRVGSVTGAIRAALDLDDAKAAVSKAMRDFGTAGVITKREGFLQSQKERRIRDANRALRLGQGHEEDLRLALLDAEEDFSDFKDSIGSGSPVARAQLGLMEAGLQVAESQARMKMEGEKAVTAFTNLAEVFGELIPSAKELVDMTDASEDLFKNMFSQEVQDAIDHVGAGFGFMAEDAKDTADDLAEIETTLPNIIAAFNLSMGQTGSLPMGDFTAEALRGMAGLDRLYRDEYGNAGYGAGMLSDLDGMSTGTNPTAYNAADHNLLGMMPSEHYAGDHAGGTHNETTNHIGIVQLTGGQALAGAIGPHGGVHSSQTSQSYAPSFHDGRMSQGAGVSAAPEVALKYRERPPWAR